MITEQSLLGSKDGTEEAERDLRGPPTRSWSRREVEQPPDTAPLPARDYASDGFKASVR